MRQGRKQCTAQRLHSTQREKLHPLGISSNRSASGGAEATGHNGRSRILATDPRTKGSMQHLRVKRLQQRMGRLRPLQLRRRRTAEGGCTYLMQIPRNTNDQPKSAALGSEISNAGAALCAQGRARSIQGARRRISTSTTLVCGFSTTSATKKPTAPSFGDKKSGAAKGLQRVKLPKGVSQLGAAGVAAAGGEGVALADRCSEMDGSRWQRVWRPSGRCCSLRAWTKEVAAGAVSSKEEERKKERRPVQTVRPTLQGPEHGGNMHENTERRHLSIDRPVCRWRANCTSGPPWRRQQRRQWQRGQRMGNVWTDPVSVSASSVAALGERDVFLDSKAPGGAERQRQRPARGRTGGPVHCGGRTLRDRRIGERGTKQQGRTRAAEEDLQLSQHTPAGPTDRAR
jgi:hypothetical protein